MPPKSTFPPLIIQTTVAPDGISIFPDSRAATDAQAAASAQRITASQLVHAASSTTPATAARAAVPTTTSSVAKLPTAAVTVPHVASALAGRRAWPQPPDRTAAVVARAGTHYSRVPRVLFTIHFFLRESMFLNGSCICDSASFNRSFCAQIL